MGTEVTNTLNAKAVQIGDDILQPYNDALGSAGAKVNVDSASLTWKAHLVESGNTAAPIKTVYMEKIPYTDFANKNDTDTGHFLDGLEQRYGIEDINSREKQLFNKLNDLRKDEKKIFAQAVNEMKGYEYSNTQERINSTGNKYGALKIEYGRFTDIKEDNGQMNLEIKGNDYFSVKPEVGAEFKYIQPLTAGTQLSVGLSAAYENELGKLNRLNQARVRYTTADWYNLRNEKEDRKGNGKFDLNIGVGNTGFGVTANLGYDTKGKNIRGGLGFKLSF